MAYETQPGTVPHIIVQHLRGLAPGAEISCSAAAALVGWRTASGLRSALRPCLDVGVLALRSSGPRKSWYRLGDGTAPASDDDDPQVRRIPATSISSVFAYADQRDAAPFSTAESSDGRLIIQRHGRVIAELTPKEARVHREFLAKRGEWEMAE